VLSLYNLFCDVNSRDVRLHEQDLESNLHYSLRHEVAMFASIGRSRLISLKQYVKALAKVFLILSSSVDSLVEPMNEYLH